MASTPCLIVGPFGGPYGGSAWDDGIYTTVRRVIIKYGDIIGKIQFEYDNNGESIMSSVHGQSSFTTTAEIKLDYPNEFLTSISGYCTVEWEVKHLVVRSLTIKSNKKTYGPYGVEKGEDNFSTSSTGCKIVGFHGRAGASLDSIGTYIVPNGNDFISIGPFGGTGGNSFDDGIYTTITRMEIRYGDGFVAIQTVYDDNGKEHWSDDHGFIAGGTAVEVKLDYPEEFLISISGYLTDSSDPHIQSLTLQSNKKTYGPYGTEQGKPFSTSTTGGKIIGLHGRSDEYINSIAAYFEPLHTTSN